MYCLDSDIGSKMSWWTFVKLIEEQLFICPEWLMHLRGRQELAALQKLRCSWKAEFVPD